MYKLDHVIFVFGIGLFHLAKCPLGSFMLSQMAGYAYFLRMNNIHLYSYINLYTTFSLYIHLSVDT